MKILVIDDNPIHQQSARETLIGHELTVVGSFDEAMRELNGMKNKKKHFEVVLTDMTLPASKEGLDPEAYDPSEMVHYGFVIALRACHIGVKYVAMITDTDHHAGPMGAALGFISPMYNMKNFRFNIDGATAIFNQAKILPNGGKDWGVVMQYLVK